MDKIGIIGAGAWGTAVAKVLSVHEKDIVIWAREKEVVESINAEHENKMFMPGVPLSNNIVATDSLSDVTDTDIIFLITPAQFIRKSLQSLKDITSDKPLVICSKGFEVGTGLLLSQIAEEEVPNARIGIMTGPTFAHELASGSPSAVTLAMKDREQAQKISDELTCRNFRIYTSDDIIGAQIGGALKNVIAIACGAAHGMKLGESAKAALMTRGLTEMGRLVSAMGANKTTLMGMCGVGDLTLTCHSMQSRNFSLGVALGEGKTLDEILGAREGKAVTEGVHTAEAIKILIDSHAVSMPICEIVYECLKEGLPIKEGMDKLLERAINPIKDRS